MRRRCDPSRSCRTRKRTGTCWYVHIETNENHTHNNIRKPHTKQDASSYRIQNTLLDQTRLVSADQKLVIWINAAMTLQVNVRRLSPAVPYGRLCNDTEVHVLPYESLSSSSSFDDDQCGHLRRSISSTSSFGSNGSDVAAAAAKRYVPHLSTSQLEQRIENARNGTAAMVKHPPPTTTSNGRLALAENGGQTNGRTNGHSNGYTNGHANGTNGYSNGNGRSNGIQPASANQHQSTAQLERSLRQQTPAVHHWFRAIAGDWADDAQLYDVYSNTANLPARLDTAHIFELYGGDGCSDSDADDTAAAPVQCHVNVRILSANEPFPQNCYPTLELPAALLRTLGIGPHVQLRLTQKERVLARQLERIELAPSREGMTAAELRDLEHDFKQLVVVASSSQPMLLNQGELLRLRATRASAYSAKGASEEATRLVTIRLEPETLRFACVDASTLRSCRVVATSTVREPIALQPPKATSSSAARTTTNGRLAGSAAATPTIAELKRSKSAHALRPSDSLVCRTGLADQQRRSEYVELDKFRATIDGVRRFVADVMRLESGQVQGVGEQFNVLVCGRS